MVHDIPMQSHCHRSWLAMQEVALETAQAQEAIAKKALVANSPVYNEWMAMMEQATADSSGRLSLQLDWSKEMVMLPEGVLEEGIVLSCVRVLQINFKSAIDLWQGSAKVLHNQPIFGISLEADGKRKLLLNGWVLFTLGTHTSRFDKTRSQHSHSFRPWAWALMKNETTLDIKGCIKSLKATAKYMWGVDLVLHSAGGDKASVCGRWCLQLNMLPIMCLLLQGLKAALQGEVDHHWSCWPHLARKLVQKYSLLKDQSEKSKQEVGDAWNAPSPISGRPVVCRCMPCSPMHTCAAPTNKGWHTWHWCLHTCARKGIRSSVIGLNRSIALKKSMTGEAWPMHAHKAQHSPTHTHNTLAHLHTCTLAHLHTCTRTHARTHARTSLACVFV